VGKFKTIKENFDIDVISNDGKMLNVTMDDIQWLIKKHEQQTLFIKELRDKLARFERYWEVAEKQSLKLHERILELQQEVDYWKTNYYVKESLSLELSSKLQTTEQKLDAMYRMVLSNDWRRNA
jgi:hypothetical protein